MITAPRGLRAAFKVDNDVVYADVIAFDDKGAALILDGRSGRLVAVFDQQNFLGIIGEVDPMGGV